MAIDREAIHAALFARLSGIAALTASSFKARRYVSWDQIPKVNQPAMLVCAHTGTASRQSARPTIWTMLAELIFYVADPNDKTLTVETSIHTILTQVEAALQRQAGEFQPDDDDPGTSLGGLVWRCFIRDYAIHHAPEGEQSALSMFIEMVAPE